MSDEALHVPRKNGKQPLAIEFSIESVRAIAELQVANELLREENGSLQIESGKLRELIRTLYHCTTSGECDECPVNGGGPVHLMPDTICDTIHDRMRELGVEP